jgi:hypothetical protein
LVDVRATGFGNRTRGTSLSPVRTSKYICFLLYHALVFLHAHWDAAGDFNECEQCEDDIEKANIKFTTLNTKAQPITTYALFAAAAIARPRTYCCIRP